MLNDIFLKIDENVKFRWSPENLEKSFHDTIIEEQETRYLNNSNNRDKSKTYWAHLPDVNFLYCRHLYRNFLPECNEVSNYLKNLQNTLSISYKGNSHLVNYFLNNKIDVEKLALIKTMPGQDVNIHHDRIVRKFAINIGLKNSNKWKVFFNKDPHISNFWKEPSSFIINDGEVFITQVDFFHSAVCLGSEVPRYLLSYNLVNE
jgi:hypothetical protein